MWCSSPTIGDAAGIWGHHASNGGVDDPWLREAFPWDEAPRYLIHDRDHAFDGFKATAKVMEIEEVVTAPHARGKIHSSNDLWDLRGASVSST